MTTYTCYDECIKIAHMTVSCTTLTWRVSARLYTVLDILCRFRAYQQISYQMYSLTKEDIYIIHYTVAENIRSKLSSLSAEHHWP